MSLRVDVFEGMKIAVRSLAAHRLRAALTVLGIGIGVATLLAILGIVQGLNASFDKQLEGVGANTLFISKMPFIVMGDWWMYRGRKPIKVELADSLRAQCAKCEFVVPQSSERADVSFMSNTLTGVDVTGTIDGYLETANFELAAGRFLTQSDNESRQPVAVLGADLVTTLFPNSSPLGATVRIDGRPFTVVGLLAKKGKILDQSFDYTVIIPLNTFQARYHGHDWVELMVLAKKPVTLDTLESDLTPIVRRLRQTPPGKPNDFEFNRAEQLAAVYGKLTNALYGVALGIGFITLLVGGIGIMNIMLVSVRERTREIGIRRALGARKQTIIWQFVIEAMLVSAIGGAIGTAVGLGGAKIVSLVTPLAAAVNPLTVVFGVSFSGFVGLVFGLWPAVRAASLDPVEALRNE
jgi:putative ABC transport system permease protein